MGIDIGVRESQGFKTSQVNRYRWRPDYEGIDLSKNMDKYVRRQQYEVHLY